MNIVSSTFQSFVAKYPNASFAASFSGFGVSLLAALKVISVVAGAGGAIFGLLAGYYTFRYRKLKLERDFPKHSQKNEKSGS